jgi:hypothetical protein
LFLNGIVGSIDLSPINELAGFGVSEIETIESFRKFIIKREIDNLISIHFSEYNIEKKGFVEPYNDPSFLELVYEEHAKGALLIYEELKKTKPSIPTWFSQKNKKLQEAYDSYKLELVSNSERDR